jgi:hypothetical protein
MEETATILQVLETGGTIGTLVLFVVLMIRGDIQPRSTLAQMEKTHEQNTKLIHQIAIESAREVGAEIGKEIANTIMHDVSRMIDSKFLEHEKKRDNNRL